MASATEPLTREDLPRFRAAFATYSICLAQPVGGIDELTLTGDDRASGLLARAWRAVEPETV